MDTAGRNHLFHNIKQIVENIFYLWYEYGEALLVLTRFSAAIFRIFSGLVKFLCLYNVAVEIHRQAAQH